MAKKAKELLTPLELKVMNLLWKHKKAYVKELLQDWEINDKDKKPNYNTVSTIVRILEKNNFVGYEAFGRTHQYFPLITKFEYQKRLIKSVLQNAFSGSASSLVSALVETEKVSGQELDEIQDLIDNSKT